MEGARGPSCEMLCHDRAKAPVASERAQSGSCCRWQQNIEGLGDFLQGSNGQCCPKTGLVAMSNGCFVRLN